MSPVLVLFSSRRTYPGRGVSRMGKRLGKPVGLCSGQGLCLMVLCAAFLLGGVAGCLFSGAAGQATVAELTQYLTDYLTAAQSGTAARCGFWSAALALCPPVVRRGHHGADGPGRGGDPGAVLCRGFLLAFSTAAFTGYSAGRGCGPLWCCSVCPPCFGHRPSFWPGGRACPPLCGICAAGGDRNGAAAPFPRSTGCVWLCCVG